MKSQSTTLNVRGQTVYMFRTSTEFCIFYTVDLQAKTVYVVAIATKDTIHASGGVVGVSTGAL